jgi:hypothetical protein
MRIRSCKALAPLHYSWRRVALGGYVCTGNAGTSAFEVVYDAYLQIAAADYTSPDSERLPKTSNRFATDFNNITSNHPQDLQALPF